MLLKKQIAESTGYKEEQVKEMLLAKMDRTSHPYQSLIESKGADPDSWAAITTAYATSDPDFYIKLIGRIK